ncbi:hypothetical protein Taro_033946 [Colocasia esculenta]|uniref:Uncharacterized protein n=1 Tax=Colocasia esculenta TaxID=4460 RepID=A0A843W662_COLES|nr:hypothetical protein [Colocasia esculenta]
MADATTPIAPCIRPLFPDLDLYSPSPPPLSEPHHLHFTVSRLRRGPMYSAYSELRESKLRKKREGSVPLCMSTETLMAPEKKVVATPSVARSVPDFSAVLRKENRKPAVWASPAPPKASKLGGTPPRPPPATVAASSKRGGGLPRRAAGSASENGRDEKGCAVRKSYSCLRELKGLSGVASSAIEEEGRAPGGNMVVKRLGRRYY